MLISKDLLIRNVFKKETDAIVREHGSVRGAASLNVITVEAVKDPRTKKAAMDYVGRLFREKEKYSPLLYFEEVPSSKPFRLSFSVEMGTLPCSAEEVAETIDEWSGLFVCPSDKIKFDAVRIEIYYFLLLLFNPELDWTTLDSMLLCHRSHAYPLIVKYG